MGWRITVKAGRAHMKNKRKTGKKKGGGFGLSSLGSAVLNAINPVNKKTLTNQILSTQPAPAPAPAPASAAALITDAQTAKTAQVPSSTSVHPQGPAIAVAAAAAAAVGPTSSTAEPNIIIESGLDQNDTCIGLEDGIVVLRKTHKDCIQNACLYYAINNLVNAFSNNPNTIIELINMLIVEKCIEANLEYLNYADITQPENSFFAKLILYCLITHNIVFVTLYQDTLLIVKHAKDTDNRDLVVTTTYDSKDPLPWIKDSLSVVALVQGLRNNNELDMNIEGRIDHFIAIKIEGNNVHIADSFHRQNMQYIDAVNVPIDRTKDPYVKTIIDRLFTIRMTEKELGLGAFSKQLALVSPSGAAVAVIPPAASSPTSSSAVAPSQAPVAPLSAIEQFPVGSDVLYNNKPYKVIRINDNNHITISNENEAKEDFKIHISDSSLKLASIPASGTTHGSTYPTLTAIATAATSGTTVTKPVVLSTPTVSEVLLNPTPASAAQKPVIEDDTSTSTISPASTAMVPYTTPQFTGLITSTNDDDFRMSFTDDNLHTNNHNRTVHIKITKAGDVYSVEYTTPALVVNPSGQASMTGIEQEPLPEQSNINTIVDTFLERRTALNKLKKVQQIKRNARQEKNAVELEKKISQNEQQLSNNIAKYKNTPLFHDKYAKKMKDYDLQQIFIYALDKIHLITLERDVLYNASELDKIYTPLKTVQERFVANITPAESPIKKLIENVLKYNRKYKIIIQTIGKLPYTAGPSIKYICNALLFAELLSKYENSNVIKELYTIIFNNLTNLYQNMLALRNIHSDSANNLKSNQNGAIFTECFKSIGEIKSAINTFLGTYSAEQIQNIVKSKSIFSIWNSGTTNLQIQFDTITRTYLANVTEADKLLKKISDITYLSKSSP